MLRTAGAASVAGWIIRYCAAASHEEYRAIVDAGFVLQSDDLRLSTYYNAMPALSLAECRRWAEKRVECVNLAIGDIAPDRVRFHTCYSIDVGPPVHDMPLKDIVDYDFPCERNA